MTQKQLQRRKNMAKETKAILWDAFAIHSDQGDAFATSYRGFLLTVCFTDIHPLVMLCLTKTIDGDYGEMKNKANEANLQSVLGCHTVNEKIYAYQYRAVHWLDIGLSLRRFYEILDRCVEEANRGYGLIAS